MDERPTIFNGEMVRAIQAGRKTQTRRLDGLHEINVTPDWWTFQGFGEGGTLIFTHRRTGDLHIVPARYRKGETRWVRETWSVGYCWDTVPPRDVRSSTIVWYAADQRAMTPSSACGKSRPSIFMPRWASRIDLKVTDVRVQRLQNISDKDAEAEGCVDDPSEEVHPFVTLWDSINAGRSFSASSFLLSGAWDRNPWVWVVEFEKC